MKPTKPSKPEVVKVPGMTLPDIPYMLRPEQYRKGAELVVLRPSWIDRKPKT